jgi:hypothetical protein
MLTLPPPQTTPLAQHTQHTNLTCPLCSAMDAFWAAGGQHGAGGGEAHTLMLEGLAAALCVVGAALCAQRTHRSGVEQSAPARATWQEPESESESESETESESEPEPDPPGGGVHPAGTTSGGVRGRQRAAVDLGSGASADGAFATAGGAVVGALANFTAVGGPVGTAALATQRPRVISQVRKASGSPRGCALSRCCCAVLCAAARAASSYPSCCCLHCRERTANATALSSRRGSLQIRHHYHRSAANTGPSVPSACGMEPAWW